MPNGQLYTSTAGVINQNYSGGAGRVTLVVPKLSFKTYLTNGDYTGKLITNKDKRIDIYSCDNITSLTAPNASEINANLASKLEYLSAQNAVEIMASSCPLLPESNLKKILDDAYTLFLAEGSDISFNISMLGTTTGIHGSDISPIHGISYVTLAGTIEYTSGTVAFNNIV